MWPWRVKMPTQTLLRLLLLLMLIVRIMLATVCYRFGSWRLVLKLNFFSDFEHKGWSRFWSWSSARFWNWSLFSILPLMFCRGYEVESHVWLRFLVDVESRFWRWNSINICVWTCNMTLARWTQPSGPLCLWQCFHSLLFWNSVPSSI